MIKLKRIFTKTIKPIPPFNFESTYKPSHFETPLEFYENGKYWITLRFLNKIFGVKMWSVRTINKPKVKIEVYSKSNIKKKDKDALIKELNWRLCFDENINEFLKIAKKDKILRKTFKNVYASRECSTNSVYELLIISLVLQNTNVKRTRTMLRNLLERYGKEIQFDNKKLFVFFPPERIAKTKEKELKDCKLGYRAPYIKAISESFAKREIDELKLRELDKEEAKKELIKLKGVGPYSANIVLKEALRHRDIFNLDIWSQKIFSKILFGRIGYSMERILKEAERRWGSWKCLAGHYIMEDLFWRKYKS